MSVVSKLRSLLPLRFFSAGKYGRVQVSHDAIKFVGHGGKNQEVLLSEVSRIEAFKHDLFAYDEITLEIVDRAGNALLVSEGDAGYEAFLASLPRHFRGLRTDWYAAVAQPPFSENRTVIWSRSAGLGNPARVGPTENPGAK